MYAIETELGRFEADTEKAAKAKLRAARRTAAREEAEQSRRYGIARLQAAMNAYKVFSRQGEGKDMPPGWRLRPVCESSTGGAVWRSPSQDIPHGAAYTLELETGRAVYRGYDPLTHYVENGAGYAFAVATNNPQLPLFSVGECEGVCALLPLYGVDRGQFKTAD